ncbi:fimbria/pilus outer membrane usher protein [Burkholderia sp. MSMB1498]|uniref:fimbria/pilus outer membrane usher protein n=1 Tax=Burkholderia sp. MSMB1498 TaxID=1637842 RepID=UPI000752E192|nr:fimbria/pilus outer membrane usher protein [Burkholderia sp. MSMB1498]KVK74292.1 fimbrial protein [Burkholderia sp. MSMB1498]
MLAAALTALSSVVRGEQVFEFDPAFLELGGGRGGADLSVYATSNRVLPGVYLVSIFVNDEAIDRRDIEFVPKSREDAVPCLTARMFDEWGVNVAALPRLAQAREDACVDIVDSVPDARVAFDSHQLRLNVTVPQAALKRRARGSVDPARWDQGINAALLDYQLSAAQYAGGNYASANSRTTLYAGLRGGINLGAWRLSHTSSFLRGLDGRDRFQIINTFVQRDIQGWNSRLMAGEGTTPSNIFDGFQFRGVQINTDETMLPDSLRGYAPTVHGVAQTNAQVTIKQNGFVIYSTYVPPGPFTIDDLYPTSSSGNLDVTITEADGHVTTFTQPYSAVPMLLRDGSWRYNVTAGQYRDGISGSHPNFAMATLARGLPGEFSLYGGVIEAGMYQSVLVGIGKNLGTVGAVSFDVTHARSAIDMADSSTVSGQAFRVLYAKAVGGWGTDFRLLAYRYSTAGYRSFADAVQLRDGSEPAALGAKRQRLEGNVNQRLGRLGSMYASVVLQTYWGSAARSTVYQLGYNGNWGRASYGLYSTYSKGNGVPSSWNVSLSLSMPLEALFGGARARATSGGTNVTYFASRNNENHFNQQVTVGGGSSDQQLNYSVGVAHSNQSDVSGTASASYLAPFGRYGASVGSGRGYSQAALTAAGGMLWHGTGLLFTQPLGDTVAVVGVPNVSGIHFEMHPGVSTNRAGEAVIPRLNPYRVNRIVIDPRRMPQDVEIRNPVSEVVPTRAAVVQAHFDSVVGFRAMFALTRPDGSSPPQGATAENDEGQALGVVGMDGETFVAGLPDIEGRFFVRWGAERQNRCHVNYTLPEQAPAGAYPAVEATCN